MMNSQQGFGGKDTDIQNFLNIIKQKGDDDKFQDMIDRMSPTTKKVENFLSNQQDQQIAGGFPKVYNPAGLPVDVYESIMRQYGKKGFGPYTTEDKIRVQNFYKKV